jgi:copper(I)-binding protein
MVLGNEAGLAIVRVTAELLLFRTPRTNIHSETSMPPHRLTQCVAVALTALTAFAATAKETGPQVQVLDSYATHTNPQQKNADVYARFVNVETTDRLVGAESDACKRVELVAGDGTKRPYESFQFHEDVEIGFREGAPHLRLVGLKRPLVHGHFLVVTLHFAETGPLELNVTVQ